MIVVWSWIRFAHLISIAIFDLCIADESRNHRKCIQSRAPGQLNEIWIIHDPATYQNVIQPLNWIQREDSHSFHYCSTNWQAVTAINRAQKRRTKLKCGPLHSNGVHFDRCFAENSRYYAHMVSNYIVNDMTKRLKWKTVCGHGHRWCIHLCARVLCKSHFRRFHCMGIRILE